MVEGSTSHDPLTHFFPGDSEMARRMRAFDWAASELGAIQSWPEQLRLTIRLCLTSRFPIWVGWGPQFRLLCNDAYLYFLSASKRQNSSIQHTSLRPSRS